MHRDIKPENLLLDKEGRVKIADFGIAKMLGADFDTAVRDESRQAATFASVAGTPQYMAPEQKTQHVTDHRADIYSLGVVLYELLTGELPADKLQPPSRKVHVDVRLDEIVLRALEAQPERRYQTASELGTHVETMINGGISPRVAPSGAAIPARFSRTAIAGACLVVMGLLSLFLSFFVDRLAARRVTSGGAVFADEPATSTAPAMLAAMLLYGAFATLLGWISVTQIRRSAGKCYGLWLGVFDGLFFPVLVLDALMFAASGAGIYLLDSSEIRAARGWWDVSLIGLGVLTVATVAWVDLSIIRAVWRAVNKKGD